MAAVALGRRAFVAEIDEEFAKLALERLAVAGIAANPSAEEAAIQAI